MKHTCAAAIIICAVIGLAGCGPEPRDPTNPNEKQISKHTSVQQVCLDGVSYYATWITDSIGSVAGRDYLVVGGPVFAKGSSIPKGCEAGAPTQLSNH